MERKREREKDNAIRHKRVGFIYLVEKKSLYDIGSIFTVFDIPLRYKIITYHYHIARHNHDNYDENVWNQRNTPYHFTIHINRILITMQNVMCIVLLLLLLLNIQRHSNDQTLPLKQERLVATLTTRLLCVYIRS